MLYKLKYIFIFLVISSLDLSAQVSYSAAKIYSLRKVVPTYTGSAIAVRRTCDNATISIGFTSCGDFDTTALKTFALGGSPLSAVSASSAACFSMRKLRCGYAGSCIRIRNSASSGTMDIGFTANGDLDTASMKTFIGSNSAFVTTWYDQSGNGRDASQATATDQPRIINAGVIEYQNNRPAIRFLVQSTCLQTAGFTAYNTACCFNGVAKVNADLTGSYNAFISKTGAGLNNNFPGPLDVYYIVSSGVMDHIVGNGTAATFFTPSQGFNAAQPLSIWTHCAQLSTSTASLNGTSILSAGASGNYGDAGQPLNIGKRNDGLTGLNGWIQEIVTFGSIPTSVDIKYLELTQSLYYSISGPTVSTYPAGAPDVFVSTWNDQSGNGANATQSTLANQPTVMIDGRLTYNSGKPAIAFNGTSNTFTAAANTTAFNNSAGGFLSVIGRNNGAASWQTFAQQGRNSTPWWGIWGDNTSPSKWTGSFSNGPGNMISTSNASAYSIVNLMQTPSTSTQLYVNGALLVNSATTANHSNSQAFTIGLSNTTEYLNGSVTELHVFPLNMQNTRRKLLESNQAANYGISISSAVYTPPSAGVYNRFVVGVGRESITDSVLGTRSTAGMGFKVSIAPANFLRDNGDYITAGIDCPVSALSTTVNCPSGIGQRWQNVWYVNKTDVGANNGSLQFYFDFSDNGVLVAAGTATNYELMYRSTSSGNFTIVPGTTKSVTGDQVLFLVDASNITTNYYYTIGTRDNNASPLPIELMGFKAQKESNTVRLNWSTASEKNSWYFLVQRSAGGIDFENISDAVSAAGNSHSRINYTLVDHSPQSGINYYRLKMVDLDGTFEYSAIEALEFEPVGIPSVFPNPADGNFTVTNCSGFSRISICNTLGKVVYSEEIKQNTVALNLFSLQEGIYFLVLSDTRGNYKTTLKLIKR